MAPTAHRPSPRYTAERAFISGIIKHDRYTATTVLCVLMFSCDPLSLCVSRYHWHCLNTSGITAGLDYLHLSSDPSPPRPARHRHPASAYYHSQYTPCQLTPLMEYTLRCTVRSDPFFPHPANPYISSLQFPSTHLRSPHACLTSIDTSCSISYYL